MCLIRINIYFIKWNLQIYMHIFRRNSIKNNTSQQSNVSNMEKKFRRTLLLNPLEEQPEFNVSEEEEQESIKDLSKDIDLYPKKQKSND